MNKHNIKINLMPKKSWLSRFKVLVLACFLITALSVSVLAQSSAIKVKADSLPILVQVAHIDFGLVFPGEELVKYFSVQFLGESEENIDYSIVEYPKPRPEFEGTLELTAEEYCRQNSDDLQNCYPDLCESLIETIVDDESDTVELASVGSNDSQDEWGVFLQVPAINGYVAQAHTFALVDKAGAYGCDLSINIYSGNGGEETYCGDGIRQTPNDALWGGPLNDGYEQCDGTDGLISGYVCNDSCVLEEENNNGGGSSTFTTSGQQGGGDYCGNGIKGIDEQCDGTDGVPEGYICNRSCQLEEQGDDRLGDEPDDEPVVTGGDDEEMGGETQSAQDRLAVLPAAPEPLVAGQTEEVPAPAEEFNVSDLKKVLGVETCQSCAWWVWLLVALLQLAGFVTYIYFVDAVKNKGETQAEMFNGEQQDLKIKGSWAWWLPVLLLQAIVFVLLVLLCAVKWLPLAIILLAYYLMLINYHAVLRNKKQWTKVLTAVLSIVPPVIVYGWCPWWSVWVWIVVLVLYILTLLAYYLSLIKLKDNVYQWWMQAVFLMTLLMLVLEWVLHWCGCL